MHINHAARKRRREHALTTLPGWACVLLATALAFAAAPLSAQVAKPEPDVEDIARTPLQDLNLDSDEIPPVLVKAAEDPYVHETLTDCNAIVAEVARLDTVLGGDYDLLGKQERGLRAGSIAKGLIGSLIPFRGIVREVTGAAGDQRKLLYAINAGMVRRGFLKGLGMGRGCAYPARPREMTMEEEVEDREAEAESAHTEGVEAEGTEAEAEGADAEAEQPEGAKKEDAGPADE